MYTVGGLFSGVGGIELGFERTGKFDILSANENDKYACKTYRNNHNHTLYEKSIYNLTAKEVRPVDILTAGSPCQAFSIPGHSKVFQDETADLFFEILRL